MAKRDEVARIKALFPDEARAYLGSNREGSYTLLDVRQPVEYEEAHLPGARLIPLPQLADSLPALNRQQPVLVYCAMGGRSKMAARLLAHQGFAEVAYLEGGINAWEAPTVSGPVAFHLKFVKGDEPPRRVIELAYQMEEGLKRFHREVQSRTVGADLRELLTKLVKSEAGHQRTLVELLEKVAEGEGGEGPDHSRLAASEESLIEGGIDVASFVRQNEYYLQTVTGYLELMMMVEAQALDLYLRMANESRNPVTKEVLLQIGDEEKQHLRMLGDFLQTQAR